MYEAKRAGRNRVCLSSGVACEALPKKPLEQQPGERGEDAARDQGPGERRGEAQLGPDA